MVNLPDGGAIKGALGRITVSGESRGVEDTERDISSLRNAVGTLIPTLEGLNQQSDRASNSLNRLGASAGTGSAGLANLQKEIVETRALQESLENSTGDLQDAFENLADNTDYDADNFEDSLESDLISKAAERLEDSADELADSVDDIEDSQIDDVADADAWEALSEEILETGDGLDEVFSDDPYNLDDLEELRHEFKAFRRQTDQFQRDRIFDEIIDADSIDFDTEDAIDPSRSADPADSSFPSEKTRFDSYFYKDLVQGLEDEFETNIETWGDLEDSVSDLRDSSHNVNRVLDTGVLSGDLDSDTNLANIYADSPKDWAKTMPGPKETEDEVREQLRDSDETRGFPLIPDIGFEFLRDGQGLDTDSTISRQEFLEEIRDRGVETIGDLFTKEPGTFDSIRAGKTQSGDDFNIGLEDIQKQLLRQLKFDSVDDAEILEDFDYGLDLSSASIREQLAESAEDLIPLEALESIDDDVAQVLQDEEGIRTVAGLRDLDQERINQFGFSNKRKINEAREALGEVADRNVRSLGGGDERNQIARNLQQQGIGTIGDALQVFEAFENDEFVAEHFERALAGEVGEISQSINEAMMLAIDSAADDSLGELDVVDDPDEIAKLFGQTIDGSSIDAAAEAIEKDAFDPDALGDRYGIPDAARIDTIVGRDTLGEISTANRFTGESDPSKVLEKHGFDTNALMAFDSVNDFLDGDLQERVQKLERLSDLTEDEVTEALHALFAASTDVTRSIDDLATLKKREKGVLKSLLGEETDIAQLYEAYKQLGGVEVSREAFESVYDVQDKELDGVLNRAKRVSKNQDASLSKLNSLRTDVRKRWEEILGEDATISDLTEYYEQNTGEVVAEGLDVFDEGASLEAFEEMAEDARKMADESLDAIEELPDAIPELIDLAEEYEDVFVALSEMDGSDAFDDLLRNIDSEGIFNLRNVIEENRDDILQGQLQPDTLADMVDPRDSRREIQKRLEESGANYAQQLNSVQQADFADIFKKVSDPDEGGTYPTRETLALATMQEMHDTDPDEEQNRMNRYRSLLETLYDPREGRGFDVTLLQQEEALAEDFYPDVRSQLTDQGFEQFTTPGAIDENLGQADFDAPRAVTEALSQRAETEGIGIEDFFGEESRDISDFVSNAIGDTVLEDRFDDTDIDGIQQAVADIFEDQLQLMMRSYGNDVARGLTDTAREANYMELMEMFPDEELLQMKSPRELVRQSDKYDKSDLGSLDDEEIKELQFEEYFQDFFPLLRRTQESDRKEELERQGIIDAFLKEFGDRDRRKPKGMRGFLMNAITRDTPGGGILDKIFQGRSSARNTEKWEDGIKKTGKAFDALIPRLEASSFNLGAFNFRVESAVKTVFSLIATLGPLISLLGATAGAAVTAAAGMATFVGVGAVSYLGKMKDEMAGIEDKQQAMTELADVFSDIAWEAMTPLLGARLGGDGMLPQQFFVQSIRRGFQLLHRFAESMAQLAELDVVGSEIEEWSEFLFGAQAGTGAFTDQLAVLLRKILPMVGDMLRYILGNFGSMLVMMADVAEDLGPKVGNMLQKFGTLFVNATYYGAGFIEMLLVASNVATELAEIVANTLNALQFGVFESEDILYGFGQLMGIFFVMNKAIGFLTASMSGLGTAFKVLTGQAAIAGSTMLAVAANLALLVGSVIVLKNAWGDLWEAIDEGDLSAIAIALGQITIALTGVAFALGNTITGLTGYTVATTGATSASWSFAGSLAAVKTGLASLLYVLGPILAGLYLLKEAWEFFNKDSDRGLFGSLFGTGAGGSLAALGGAIGGILLNIYGLKKALSGLGKITSGGRFGTMAKYAGRFGDELARIGQLASKIPFLGRIFPAADTAGDVARATNRGIAGGKYMRGAMTANNALRSASRVSGAGRMFDSIADISYMLSKKRPSGMKYYPTGANKVPTVQRLGRNSANQFRIASQSGFLSRITSRIRGTGGRISRFLGGLSGNRAQARPLLGLGRLLEGGRTGSLLSRIASPFAKIGNAVKGGKLAQMAASLGKITSLGKYLPFIGKLVTLGKVFSGPIGWAISLLIELLMFSQTGELPTLQMFKDFLYWIASWDFVWDPIKDFFLWIDKWARRLENWMGQFGSDESMAESNPYQTTPVASQESDAVQGSTYNPTTGLPTTDQASGNGTASQSYAEKVGPTGPTTYINSINVDNGGRRDKDIKEKVREGVREAEEEKKKYE